MPGTARVAMGGTRLDAEVIDAAGGLRYIGLGAALFTGPQEINRELAGTCFGLSARAPLAGSRHAR